MLGDGKLCRYELHHPMSFGDVLAALFRGKPKKQRPEDAEALLGLGPKPVNSAGEAAVALTGEGREEAIEAQMPS